MDTRREYRNEEHTAQELKEEILSNFTSKEELENDIPEHLFIGAFNVSVEKVKLLLIKKRSDIINCLLEDQANYLREKIEEIIEVLKYIYTKLGAEPSNIEALQEMREWIETLPVIITEQMENFQKLKTDYDVLEFFHWNLADEDFQAKVEAMQLPLLIQTRVSIIISI